jgi:hypothetical protein
MKNFQTGLERRVTKAWLDLQDDDYEGALYQICSAVEFTAKAELNRREITPVEHKAFLRQNMDILCSFMAGTPLAGLSFDETLTPTMNAIVRKREGKKSPAPENRDTSVSLEEVIYHIIRCEQYHSAGLPDDIRLSENALGVTDGVLDVPKQLVTGLVLSVVASPANQDRRTDNNFFFHKGGVRFNLNDQWGRRDELTADLISIWKQTQNAEKS